MCGRQVRDGWGHRPGFGWFAFRWRVSQNWLALGRAASLASKLFKMSKRHKIQTIKSLINPQENLDEAPRLFMAQFGAHSPFQHAPWVEVVPKSPGFMAG